MASSAHESVSIGKPPIHPHSQRSVASIAPAVHSSSNNRLYNNTIFTNNQYTFSLSRNGGYGYAQSSGDGGYLDTRPFSTASLYEDSGRVSRGTKSDIGVSSRRHHPSSSKSFINNQSDCKSKLPSVKSDFLLSYLSNSSSCNTAGNTSRTNSLASGAYHISDGSDYHFKTASKYLHSSGNGNASKRNHSGNAQPRQSAAAAASNICLSPTTSVMNNSSNNNNGNNQRNNSVVNTSNFASQMNSNAVGPLLYLDSSASNRLMSNHEYTSNSQLYQSMQSVSKNSVKKCM